MTQPSFVDTSVWVAYFDRSDKDHPVFKTCLPRVVGGNEWRLHTSDYVIDETATFLRYHTNHATACVALDRFRDLAAAQLLVCHSVDSALRLRAESIFRQYQDQSFSFTDCTSFVLCQAHELRHVVTCDSDFRLFGLLLVPEDVSP